MKFLLLFFFVEAVLCTGEDGGEKQPDSTNLAWVNEGKFKEHQDAWKSIEQDGTSTYYLVLATYENDDVWGDQFRCVSVSGTILKEAENTIQATINFKNSKTETLQSSKEKVTAVSMFGYQMKNAIKYEPQGEVKTIYEDALVFSDYKTCDVFYAPKTKNKEGESVDGYELWVSQENLNEVPDCCKFLFLLLAENRTVYQIYNKDCEKLQSSNGHE